MTATRDFQFANTRRRGKRLPASRCSASLRCKLFVTATQSYGPYARKSRSLTPIRKNRDWVRDDSPGCGGEVRE